MVFLFSSQNHLELGLELGTRPRYFQTQYINKYVTTQCQKNHHQLCFLLLFLLFFYIYRPVHTKSIQNCFQKKEPQHQLNLRL